MTIRIEATRLIPGRGEPVDNGVVVLEGDKIAYAGAATDAPPTEGAETVTADTVMPGLWECHGHFMGIRGIAMEEMYSLRPQAAAMRATTDARAVLEAGFTSVREVGGMGVHLAKVIDEGVVVGPNVYASGGALSMTAGHGDSHAMDLEASRQFSARFFGEDDVVDGPDGARAGVRRMLRMGARVIKVHASGGVMSQIDDPHLPQFSAAELEAIVDEASRMERLVCAHCHGKRGMMAAIEAGIKTIEHGTYMDEETADAMVENDVMLIPTRYIVDFLTREGEKRGIPDYAMQKMRTTAEYHANGIALAVSKGVKIALGTDIWSSSLWGTNGKEFSLMTDVGLTPLQAIEAGTANGPDTLGPQAPKSGQLIEGWDADVITVDGDPLADITILGDPAKITGVFKGGQRVKG